MEEEEPALLSGMLLCCLRVGACIGSVWFGAFHVVAIWALVQANTGPVFEACGYSLWVFVLVHLLLPLLMVLVACCVVACLYLLLSSMRLDPRQGHSAYIFTLVVLVVLYYAVLSALGGVFTWGAMQAAGCQGALAAVGWGGVPLLGVVGWIYVALDSLSLLVGMCLLLGLLYVQFWLR